MKSTKLLPDSHITALMFPFPLWKISALVPILPAETFSSPGFCFISEAMQECVEAVLILSAH